MRRQITMVAVVLMTAASAHAVVMPLPNLTTGHYANDAEYLANYTGDISLVAEGRWGQNNINGDWEVGIWNESAGYTLVDQTDNLWGNGDLLPFSVSYDPLSDLFTFSVGQAVTTYIIADWSAESVFIRTRAAKPDSVSYVGGAPDLGGLVVDGIDISPAASLAVNSDDGVDYLWIDGIDVSDGFLMTGWAGFEWGGIEPQHSNAAFQIKFGDEPIVPEPATMSLLGLAVAGLIARKKLM